MAFEGFIIIWQCGSLMLAMNSAAREDTLGHGRIVLSPGGGAHCSAPGSLEVIPNTDVVCYTFSFQSPYFFLSSDV